MLITILNGTKIHETDSWKTCFQTLKAILPHYTGTITINVGNPSDSPLPPVAHDRPDQLRDLADRGEMPRKVRKQRSDKGKARK